MTPWLSRLLTLGRAIGTSFKVALTGLIHKLWYIIIIQREKKTGIWMGVILQPIRALHWEHGLRLVLSTEYSLYPIVKTYLSQWPAINQITIYYDWRAY